MSYTHNQVFGQGERKLIFIFMHTQTNTKNKLMKSDVASSYMYGKALSYTLSFSDGREKFIKGKPVIIVNLHLH